MEIGGLPLHPLVVHGAVVLVPLSALGALAVILWGRAREHFGWLTVAFAVAAAAFAVAARLSGEALADALGAGPLVVTHRMWGQLVPFPTVALAIALPAALLLRTRSRAGWWVAASLTVVAAVAGLALVVVTGDSGARAVWGSS
ncbi:MAG: hypothetical protein QM779_15805 [Propionicimonas sp.]|uniref:DUF2231 domain-containing protein n=1 Tax=Propionicimonas sp. TaxID=1955623 RepID=UPI003D1499CB